MEEELKTKEVAVENTDQPIQKEEAKPVSFDDGVIKVNLDDLNKPKEEEKEVVEVIEKQPESIATENPVVKEVETPEAIESVIEEITEEQVQEKTEQLTEDVKEAIEEQKQSGIELPENIQKVVEFMNETGGSLEDYVKLNTDYSTLSEKQLLREYYENTKPYLDKEDIDILMDDFSYDEDIDDERTIRKSKLAYKEEIAKAKDHLEGLKGKYYEEIKAGSKLNPDQQKAVEFFNRYKQENEEATKVAEKQVSTFKSKTEKLFSDEFKGFDFNVGEKKFRFKVNNAEKVKTEQSDINNFVKKFLNEKNEMADAAGYHKSLFTAMNADAIANHFYEQGKADAIKNSVQNAKNIDMSPRGTHESIKASNGWTVKSVSGGQSSSKLKIRSRK
mgnify:CR=1 FL=1